MDADGFTTVTYHKKKTTGFAYTEHNQKRALSRKQQKRKQLVSKICVFCDFSFVFNSENENLSNVKKKLTFVYYK